MDGLMIIIAIVAVFALVFAFVRPRPTPTVIYIESVPDRGGGDGLGCLTMFLIGVVFVALWLLT